MENEDRIGQRHVRVPRDLPQPPTSAQCTRDADPDRVRERTLHTSTRSLKSNMTTPRNSGYISRFSSCLREVDSRATRRSRRLLFGGLGAADDHYRQLHSQSWRGALPSYVLQREDLSDHGARYSSLVRVSQIGDSLRTIVGELIEYEMRVLLHAGHALHLPRTRITTRKPPRCEAPVHENTSPATCSQSLPPPRRPASKEGVHSTPVDAVLLSSATEP